jgi:hypothetical protein
MKNIVSVNKMVLGGALIAWIVPMLVSFFMIDPETQAYLPNELVFKATMIAISAAVTFFFFNKLKKMNLLQVQVPHTFLIINVLLDIAVLIGVFAMPFTEWVTTVFPAYIVIFYGLYYLLKNK